MSLGGCLYLSVLFPQSWGYIKGIWTSLSASYIPCSINMLIAWNVCVEWSHAHCDGVICSWPGTGLVYHTKKKWKGGIWIILQETKIENSFYREIDPKMIYLLRLWLLWWLFWITWLVSWELLGASACTSTMTPLHSCRIWSHEMC